MAALKRIQVKGFKSIREMDLELRPLNILIGANGSGKSNFLSVFDLMRWVIRKKEDLAVYVMKAGGADTLLHFGQKVTQDMEFKFDFEDHNYETVVSVTSGDLLRMTSSKSSSEEKAQRFFQRNRIYHFDDTSESAKIKGTSRIDNNFFLQPDGGNLASILYLLRERQRPFYDRIIETIQLVAPFFDDFILQPTQHNPDTIQLDWREVGADTTSKAFMLSDGTLRFMCLATLLRQPNPPPLILIDEPELGLHPYAITLLAGLLKGAATKTQVIVSTQSPTLVNLFEPEDIIVVDRKDKASTFHRLDRVELQDWLEDYNLSELWQKNVIGADLNEIWVHFGGG